MKSKHRVQKHGEVFTPQWVVDKMVAIPGIKERTEDVFATFLEPSAGEGAFLLAIEDMKLKFVTDTYSGDAWNTHALWALSGIYGIEYLEDNLEIARENMLELFADYYKTALCSPLSKRSDLYKSARTIIWANVVQGDTLTRKNNFDDQIIFSRWKPVGEFSEQVRRITFSYASLFADKDIASNEVQIGFFDVMNANEETENNSQECYALTDIEFVWKEKTNMSDRKSTKFKFDVVIGNPPYQEESTGEGTQTPPIYHRFMDEAYKIAERVSFITPARFLYNAGATPKAWNQKMLGDAHLKVEYFEQDSSKIFSNTDIKGGVAVTYRDSNSDFGAIGIFTAFSELNSILVKVSNKTTETIETLITGRGIYRLTDSAIAEYPQILDIQSEGHKNDVGTNAFKILDGSIYFKDNPADGKKYIQIIGLLNNERVYRYMRKDFVNSPYGFDKYKVILPKSNGSGAIGEVLSTPLIGDPLIGFTETFISIGSFYNKPEAQNCLKYIKSKFARTMLGVLKVTQDNPRDKWKYVPLQDFTSASDIDWTKMVREIDRQLYKKYGLDDTEIEFIESHVKEMK